MTSRLNTDEQLVSNWLSQRGYEAEYESVIVTSGGKPDFLAVAVSGAATPRSFWCEVKSLRPDNTESALSRFYPTLEQLGVPHQVHGHAMLEVTERTREQSVRALVKMFFGKARVYASNKVRLIFIQQLSADAGIRSFEVDSPIIEKVWVRGAGDGAIAVPLSAVEDSLVSVSWNQNGRLQTEPAFKIFDWNLPFDCALIVSLDPKDHALTSISCMSHGSSNVPSRALNALETANSQIRNAYRFISAPGMVFLVPEEHVDDQTIAMGAYGRLTVEVDSLTRQFGDGFYGREGAFRRDKNTHISAVIRLRRNGQAGTYFPNPFAKERIDENNELFSGLRRAPVRFQYPEQ